jgi:hypothetical protein
VDRGYTRAWANLGECHLKGEGTDPNPGEAIADFQRGAEAGQSDCQSWLGRIYLDGKHVPQDLAEAYRWYQKAADQGNPTAVHQLGWFYQNGLHVPTNLPAAIAQYESAGEKGFALSWWNLALIYDGAGEYGNASRARIAFARGAELGHSGCMVRTARCWELGLGGPKDVDQAMNWYKKAMDKGEGEARSSYQRLASPPPLDPKEE